MSRALVPTCSAGYPVSLLSLLSGIAETCSGACGAYSRHTRKQVPSVMGMINCLGMLYSVGPGDKRADEPTEREA